MKKPVVLANAVTLTLLVFYFACALLSFIAPDFVLSIGQSWIHTLNLEAARPTSQISLTGVIFGAVTFGVSVWVVVYLTAFLYGKLEK
ncbi:MAG: hypothetical protein A2860_00075 [Candidatus Levybacteria bacterium RIFCSPHIGHO2_01_FULL_37_33]|nr:MAG: hypothetical protein A2860_00075 [Candidatus Levybacteria bacterium RIFCSPHIGHO2_01_FULL_37_33]OGH16964.1 MAG: hypothetical protein A3C97_03655 [Candidatus Levybacteria bacterium RIFCSPHIGHO2_02_FULL_37_11]OGH29197.1 MAG: hypothetical protein A3F30_04345 [Candidatus Levybacteria bacterium RIFCSPHIGHO2_12_FULL_37_12]OGH33202.1 MAG: hypothetical protein A2953_02985 [Candidatus Levybacteria bacterium RIFCSPLOWO2_01_FULL_36_54]